jgi:hypothetical protein
MIALLGASIRGDVGPVGNEQKLLSVRRQGGIPVLVLTRERDWQGFGPVVSNLFAPANDTIVGQVNRFSVRHKSWCGLLIWSSGAVLHKDGRFCFLRNEKAILTIALADN